MQLLRRRLLALATALLLLMTPAHYLYGRLALEAIYGVPCVLAWLLGLLAYLERPRLGLIAASAACLGFGVYSTTTAPLAMALFAGVTAVALWRSGARSAGPYMAAAAEVHRALGRDGRRLCDAPATYVDTMGRWAIHAAHLRRPWEGLEAFANWNTLGTRASTYWELLNPAHLFLGSPTSAMA